MELFKNILINGEPSISFENLVKILKRPYINVLYRISVLNPDESVRSIIPPNDIPEGGIQYTEEYQNGQRRNISLQLINSDKKYTPSINGLWLSSKFSFEVGIQAHGKIQWFPKGIYIMGDVNLENQDSDKTVSIQLKDKYAIFEGKMGTLEEAYEIETGSTIFEVVNNLKSFTTGSGYIFDYKDIIMDPSLIEMKTQSTIRIDEGGNLGQVIDALATQLSAEYYYNDVGNLCFYPINETIDDSNKPIIWVYEELKHENNSISLTYKNEEVVNVVKVVGDNIDNGIHSAIVSNENPASPICIGQIGRRVAPKYTEANVWSDDIAYSLAQYKLRQASFLAVDFNCNVIFNPLLAVNNICEVENKFLGLEREKLLITSISFTSSDGQMQLKLCNTKELPFI